MKELLKYLALFVFLSVVISGLNGCTTQPVANSNAVPPVNTANQNGPANAAPSEAKTTAYPQLAPAVADASLELPDGSTSKVSDHKGKVVLVSLWAVWCGPCIGEMPTLVDLQQKYGAQGFEVIGLNVGKDDDGHLEDLATIKAFGEKMKLNYTLARVSNETARQFYHISNASYIPQTFLINRDGQLRGVFTGGGPSISAKIQETVAKAMTE